MIFTSDATSDLRFISIIPAQNEDDSFSIQQSYQELRDYLESNNLSLFHERVYGLLSAAEPVMTARNSVFGKDEISLPPLTYVEGSPVDNKAVAGIHVIAVSGKNQNSLHPVRKKDTQVGQVFTGGEAEFLMLSDIGRVLPDDSRIDRLTETTHTIRAVDEILTEQQWSFKDVFRTWFYLDNILDWYDEFNMARNNTYHNIGLMNGSINSVIPASTGIFGRNTAGYACTLDLLALRPLGEKPFQVQRMVNPRQNEATEYGSAFSRGITISMEKSMYFFLSGTASIDEKGNTIHPGDMRKQTRRTLENVESLINNAGGKLSNIQQATAFVKNKEDIPIFEEEIHRNGMSDIPIIVTIADVCRDDLLVELDATAVVAKQTAN